MTKRAILIDLDDTLVAFDEVTVSSWRQVCAEYCGASHTADPLALAARIQEHSDLYWGDPDRHRWGRAHIGEARRGFVGAAFSALGLPAEDAPALADRYGVVRLENMYLLDGVTAVLERLRSDGCLLALVTNGDGPGQREKIRRFDLDGHFDAVVIEGEVGFGKPDVRIFRAALGMLGTDPRNATMVGDNAVWDVQAPQSLGIDSVWIDRKGVGRPPGGSVVPWRTIRRFAELPAAMGLEP